MSLRGAQRRGNLKPENRDCFASLAMTGLYLFILSEPLWYFVDEYVFPLGYNLTYYLESGLMLI